MKTKNTNRKIGYLILISSIVFNLLRNVVTFNSANVDSYFFGVFNFVSIIILAVLVLTTNRIKSFIRWIVSLGLLFFAFLFFVFTFGFTTDYYEKIQEIPGREFNVAVYRTDCGATCSYGIVVKKEKPFMFDVLKSEYTVASFYRVYELKVQKIDENTLRVLETDASNRTTPNVSVGSIIRLSH